MIFFSDLSILALVGLAILQSFLIARGSLTLHGDWYHVITVGIGPFLLSMILLFIMVQHFGFYPSPRRKASSSSSEPSILEAEPAISSENSLDPDDIDNTPAALIPGATIGTENATSFSSSVSSTAAQPPHSLPELPPRSFPSQTYPVQLLDYSSGISNFIQIFIQNFWTGPSNLSVIYLNSPVPKAFESELFRGQVMFKVSFLFDIV